MTLMHIFIPVALAVAGSVLYKMLVSFRASGGKLTLPEVGLVAVGVVFVGAWGVLKAEEGAPGANITTFGDALWWALVTSTTVGYGDRFPVTTEGRLVAAAIIISGVAIFATLTAIIAAWLMSQERDSVVTTHEVQHDVMEV